MSISLTVEQLEPQVAQLPPHQQLQLLACISEKLSVFTRNLVPEKETEEKLIRQETATPASLARIDAWLTECDRVAELWERTFGSTADLRRLRNEE